MSIVFFSILKGPRPCAKRARSTISTGDRRGKDQSSVGAAGLAADAGAGAGGGGASTGGGGTPTASGAVCAASATGAGDAGAGANAARRVAPTRAVRLPGV